MNESFSPSSFFLSLLFLWLIYAHGVCQAKSPISSFIGNLISLSGSDYYLSVRSKFLINGPVSSVEPKGAKCVREFDDSQVRSKLGLSADPFLWCRHRSVPPSKSLSISMRLRHWKHCLTRIEHYANFYRIYTVCRVSSEIVDTAKLLIYLGWARTTFFQDNCSNDDGFLGDVIQEDFW